MKRLACMLAFLLILTIMPITGFAAVLTRISDILPDAWDNSQQMAEGLAYLDGEAADDLESLECSPGQELRIYLHGGMFADENGRAVGSEEEGITLSQLRGSNITLVEEIYEGADSIEEIALDYERNTSEIGIMPGTVYIKVVIAEAPREQEIDILLTLKVKGALRSETEIRVAGTLDSDVVYVDDNDHYIDIQNGEIIQAQDDIPDCRLDLGSGFVITASLVQGRRYSGSASARWNENEIIYQISQSNLASGLARFELDEIWDVYNDEGDYLGTTEDHIPILDTYFLYRRNAD